MKRFTETGKWRDPWFINLSGPAKLLWCYLTDNCDAIGLIHIDLRLVSRDCVLPIKEKHITELGDRVQALGNWRFFLPKFIQFQYGELSADCPPHRTLLKLVRQHGLTRSGLGYCYPTVTLTTTLQDKTRQDQDKTGSGSVPDGGAGGNPPEPPPLKPEQAVLRFLNTATGREFRETENNLDFIRHRLAERDVTVEGVKTMILRQCKRWIGTDQSEYLRPETLFNKTKFDGYYAAKDLPVAHENQRNSSNGGRPITGADQRKIGIPEQPGENLSDLLARRDRRATAAANAVATTPPQPQRGDAGSAGHE